VFLDGTSHCRAQCRCNRAMCHSSDVMSLGPAWTILCAGPPNMRARGLSRMRPKSG
jgi:hypothetical protein